jgi:tripartite-type tricarboxylate transporter receptor subunit TctC
MHGLVAGAALGVLPWRANAAGWPERPVKLIVPFAPGGNTDGIARLIGQYLSQKLGQTFVVENRLGAGGIVAADTVARSAHDGYTLMMAALPQIAILPVLQKTNYDPIKDFAPISNVATNPFVLIVHKDVPVKSVAEFVAYVKAHKDTISYASAGVGSLSHLAMALFLKQAKIEMTHVPYKGNAPSLADVVAGHLPTMFSNLSDALPQMTAGNVRAIAVSGDKRAVQAPDVPTVAESGYPTYKALTWNGLVAPAGTPKEIIDKVAKVVEDACKEPAFAQKLAAYGVDPLGNTPEEFAKMIKEDMATWATALKAAGVEEVQ